MNNVLDLFWKSVKESGTHMLAPCTPKFWRNQYYIVKDFLFPHNVIKLRRISNSFQETETLMEESLLQLLEDFYKHQQPFHSVAGVPYERNPTIETHRKLLNWLYGPDSQQSYQDTINEALNELEKIGECTDKIRHIVTEATHSRDYARTTFEVHSKLLDILDWYLNGGMNVESVGAYFSNLHGGESRDDAWANALKIEEQKTENLKYIIEHRDILWT